MRGGTIHMRAMVAVIGFVALCGCAAEAPIEQPAIYLSMANGTISCGRSMPAAAWS